MRVDEILSIADSLMVNQISEELKLHWINEVEGRVHCEIMKAAPADFVSVNAMDHELSVPMPYAKMYLSYILAMIAFADKEYDLYTDVMMKFERDFCEYAKFYLRTR